MKTSIFLLCFTLAFVRSERTLADLEKDVNMLENYIKEKQDALTAAKNEKLSAEDSKFKDDLNLIKSIEDTNHKLDSAVEPDQERNANEELLKAIKAGNKKRDHLAVEDDLDAMLKEVGGNVKKAVDIDILSNKEKCKDTWPLNYCAREVVNKRCITSEKDMVERCAMSCGYCCFDQAEPSLCQILRDKQKLCERDPKRMHKYCRKSCGLCFKRAPAVPPCMLSQFGCCWDKATIATAKVGTVGDGCPKCKNDNSDSFCEVFKHDCKNRYDKGYDVWRHCPVTCGACNATVCEDHPDEAKNCAFYKDQGYCTVQKSAMKFFCEKTCNLCETACEDHPDEAKNCAFYKDQGYCDVKKNAMKSFCEKTCNLCDSKYECHDESAGCKDITTPLNCERYATIVKDMCKVTCGFC